ncbi:MAG: T9SS type A sorting domain-containing protein [Lewinellaceae bacterium]|nr:T9SS type A sorting domain-containing protein [Lewinellaceae bacterium]
MNETYSVESDASQWDLERELLFKLLTYPELITANSFEEAWYDSKENASPWKFAKAERAFLDAYEFPGELQYGLDSLYARYSTLWDDLLELDSLQRIDPYTVDNGILQDQITAAEDFEEVRIAIDSLHSECNDFTLNELSDVEDLNDNLPDTTAYEANLKNVYEIIVKSAQGNALIEDDYDILRDIAGQCPLEGGSAVRIAPYHLPHDETVSYLHEEQSAEECEALGRGQAGLSGDWEISLKPNPASDIISVQFSKVIIERYGIYDVTGKLIEENASPVASNTLGIPLSNMPDGIFFLKLIDESNRLHIRKFVISR